MPRTRTGGLGAGATGCHVARAARTRRRDRKGPYEPFRLINAGGLPAPCRLHVLRGEAEPDVLGEALLALLGHEGSAALGFMTERLASRDLVVAQAAALALGDWRDPAALPPIVTRLGDEHRPEVRRALVLGDHALRGRGAEDVARAAPVITRRGRQILTRS